MFVCRGDHVLTCHHYRRVEPSAGTLLTFVQFLFVAVTGYISQFDQSRPPLFLRPNKVPIKRWIVNIVLFFSINVLNNHAFSYDISVPVHIILRSGGSITTMIAGSLWGKKYPRIQIIAVILLTIGVIVAAWSDAQSKVSERALLFARIPRGPRRGNGANSAGQNIPASDENTMGSTDGRKNPDPEKPSFGMGLTILFVAQILSAIMGLYTEETYKKYGPQWKENLFYSHLLSLPLFLPFMPSLIGQFNRLAQSPSLTLPGWGGAAVEGQLTEPGRLVIPSQLAYLVINVLTQYACIRGVNLLAAASTALTVTIVLNIRKLVSLLLSIWLFGNRLAPGTMVGAIVVFGAGGLYSLDSGKKKTPRPQQKEERN